MPIVTLGEFEQNISLLSEPFTFSNYSLGANTGGDTLFISSVSSTDSNMVITTVSDTVVKGDDIFGDGVNIAARIEPLAHPGGICITEAIYQSVKSKLDIKPKRIDEVDLKHIDDKYTIYKLPNVSNDDEEKNTNEFDFSKDKIMINSIAFWDHAHISNSVNVIIRRTYPPGSFQ